MKVFWSWQSDTPGKIGRHFARNAISAAISAIKDDVGILEPESRDGLHIDHDRQGVAGSPELAQTILKKIEQSVVFIADVTPVGLVSTDLKKNKESKKLINSNVGIELGYALHTLSDASILMVMNEFYGSREDLPFDLRSKAGPITFKLGPDASKVEIESEFKRLTSVLIEAIALCIKENSKTQKSEELFSEATAVSGNGLFFKLSSELAGFGKGPDQTYKIHVGPSVYIRVFPQFAQRAPGLAKMKNIFDQYRVMLPSMSPSGIISRNTYGPIFFDPISGVKISSLTQGFPTGELWGINTRLFHPDPWVDVLSPLERRALILPVITYEQIMVRTLRNYFKVETALLEFKAPFIVEIGSDGIKGTLLEFPNYQPAGPIMHSSFSARALLNNEEEIFSVLGDLFSQFYDLAAVDRSKVFSDQQIQAHDIPPM